MTQEPELPRGVALAWGVAANPQRGPKREMSIERIVDAAVALADEGGLGAVSMSSVAASLGFTPMSLYRYVTAKDDLVLLMQEQGIGVPPESVLEAEGWRTGLSEWAAAQSEVYRRHPWLLDIEIEGTPTTPNNLAWLDAALAVLSPTGLAHVERVSVALAVLAQVRWRGVIERGYDQASARAGITPDDLDYSSIAVLKEFVTAEEFPEVHAAITGGAFDPQEGGDPFAFGLDRVLDGVETYLGGAARPVEHEPIDPLTEQALRDPKVREVMKARREQEKRLREARKREREAIASAREKLAR